MVPDVGISRPANIMSKVLLPQPLGPMTTRNSPWPTVRLTFSRAITSRGVPAPHTLVMSVQMISPMLAPHFRLLSLAPYPLPAVGYLYIPYSCAVLFHHS